MGFPKIEAVFSLLEEYPELYLDATLVLPYTRPGCEDFFASLPEGHRFMDILTEGLERHAGRVMYGSDHPVGMGGLSDIYKDLEGFPVSEDVKRAMRANTPKAFVSRFVPDFDWSLGLDQLEQGGTNREG